MNKEKIRALITTVLSILPMKKRIIFESNPDLSCNAYPVFEYIRNDSRFDNVQLLWLVKDPKQWENKYSNLNIKFVSFNPDKLFSRIHAIFLAMTSKCLVTCNKTIWVPRKGQLSLFLGHGTPIKECKGVFSPGKFCNMWAYPSESVKSTMEEQFELNSEQGRLLGYPRCDALFHPISASDKLLDKKGKKLVFWLPTFRQHTNKYSNNYTLPGCGLPLLSESDSLERLNDLCEKYNILLVLKPHPVQDMSAIKAGKYSSFSLLYDKDLQDADVRLYEVLADADALITDYSSVYCDFLLTDKPIALTFDDLEQYEKNRGLVMKNIKEIVKGSYLYNLDDLELFFKELSSDKDTQKEERAQANDYYNYYHDDGATKRVVNILSDYLVL